MRPENIQVHESLDVSSLGRPFAELLNLHQGSGDSVPDKRTLLLTENKGPFLRPCPGTRNYICCGYRILHVGTGCPMDCSYCILQAYLSDHRPTVFTNRDRLVRELAEQARCEPGRPLRLGTGEFTDSLHAEPYAGFVEFIVPHIQETSNLVLEFKTKTVEIGSLLKLKNPDRVIVSFSMNSRRISRSEERGAATLRKRIHAAEQCLAAGFKLGFHFDPLIYHPGWQEEYRETVHRIFERIDPSSVIWISLGCLRFMPDLKSTVRRNHPDSRIFSNEFVKGLDGKLRYFRPIREEMYGVVGEALKSVDSRLCVYLCMESDLVWKRSLGFSPGNSEGLADLLDRRTRSFFPSLKLSPEAE